MNPTTPIERSAGIADKPAGLAPPGGDRLEYLFRRLTRDGLVHPLRHLLQHYRGASTR